MFEAKREVLSALRKRQFAEFFAGVGLMRLGLEKAGWCTVFANDIAEDKYEIYAGHFGDAVQHFLLGDIHDLKADEVPPVGLATASFPCNDLSLAGMRRGLGGKQSSAFWGFVRILDEMRDRRPPLVLLENVPGFLTSRAGKDFQAALAALNRLGYAADAVMLDAEWFVPQSRLRLFVIGVMQSGDPTWQTRETSAFYQSTLRPSALAGFIFEHPEIRWRIRDLPDPPRRRETLKDILDDLPNDSPYWWSKERTEYLVNQMSPRHANLLRSMQDKEAWSFGTVFRRVRNGRSMAELRTDGVAGCLRTPRGGSGRQILVRAGYGEVWARLLTPRECARLMGAGEYTIEAPLNQALFGFGDAVCVPVVSWLARHYINPVASDLLHALGKPGGERAPQ